MNWKSAYRQQRGITSVEFAIIATVLFMTLFAVIEFGRLLFVWNVLDEVTRRGARLAAVCPVTQTASIQNQAVFGGTVIPGLVADNVDIEYLDEDGGPVLDPANPANFPNIFYVRASIDGYTHNFIVPWLGAAIEAPDFSTTIPRESLGVHPAGAGAADCS
ncbi:TadE/TadG family type IV pilus assembly protein [Marinobacterium arenosum]|uniref:TadE/TadG family type IV pilus assembly protein n=1 Tax=Marinobacterium arenosum TaxID=2862496 RepID=UPI001C978CBC|nr:TadE family protein [Marinobacterium arenosum]MBY4675738.1 pilus assembly protein [Marinobacterium arenosum]